MAVDLKTLTPDTTLPQTGFLFGADSQSAANPSVYPVANVKDAINSGIATLTAAPSILWDCAASPVVTVTLNQNATIFASNFKAGGTYKLVVFQDATGGRTLAYDPFFHWPNDVTPTVSSGASAMTVLEFVSDGTGIFGAVSQPYDGYVPTIAAVFNAPSMEYRSPSWIDNSGTTGNRMVTDSTGTLTWAPHNLLLNSATLATQTVTVTVGATNILSFFGTGSITLSGAATGTLSGTGATNRVSLIVTPTTTSLTLTVSGSVTQAQLERVTYQTQPRAYIPTTSAAVFLPRYDYSAATAPATPLGMLIEESRTNLLNFSQSFATTGGSQNNWADTNITRNSTNNLSPDGTANALRVTASAANGTIISSAAIGTSAARTLSVWLRRVTGTGDIQYTLDNGSNWTTQAITSAWVRYTFASTTANQQVGFRIVTSGDAIEIWGAQLEAGAFTTSYIPTTTGTATRLADVVKLSGTALTTVQAQAASVIAETRSFGLSGYAFEAEDGNAALYNTRTILFNSFARVSNGGATQATLTWSPALTLGNINRMALAYAPANFAGVANNGTVATVSSGTVPSTITQAWLGRGRDGTNLNGYVRSLALYNTRLPDATLKSKSTVGAAY